MDINTNLICPGENFNLVIDNIENARTAFHVTINVLNEMGMLEEAKMLSLDVANL